MELTSEKSCCSAGNDQVDEQAGITHLKALVFIYIYACAESLQLCLTLCDPMDCSLPGPSVHGISQARILEWVAISFFRELSQARNQTRVSCIADSLPNEL